MSPLLGRFGAPLEVDDRVTRARLSPSRLADRDIKRLMDTVQRAIPIPQLKIEMRRAFRRQIFRQSLPLAAGREHIEDSVEDFALVDRPPPSAAPGRRNERSNQHGFSWKCQWRAPCSLSIKRALMLDATRLASISLPSG
jgi:hypothetical protein